MKQNSQQESTSWFEFQLTNRIGKQRNDNHLDCLVIDDANKRILFIEVKRFKSESKISEIGKDAYRIINVFDDRKDEFFDRIVDYDDYKFYGVLLSDVWLRGNDNFYTRIFKSYEESSLFSNDSFFKEKLFADDKIPRDKVISRMENGGLKYFMRHVNMKQKTSGKLYLLMAVFELK